MGEPAKYDEDTLARRELYFKPWINVICGALKTLVNLDMRGTFVWANVDEDDLSLIPVCEALTDLGCMHLCGHSSMEGALETDGLYWQIMEKHSFKLRCIDSSPLDWDSTLLLEGILFGKVTKVIFQIYAYDEEVNDVQTMLEGIRRACPILKCW